MNAFGGPVSPVTEVLTGQTSQRWPHSLPDGGLLLFIQSGVPDSQGVFFVKLGATPTRVLDGAAAARFVPPDWLLVVRQGVLSAFRFDPQRGVISGDPLPIAQGVNVFQNLGVFSVSPAPAGPRLPAGQRRAHFDSSPPGRPSRQGPRSRRSK